MAAKIEFSKNYKKISFADMSEISPKRDITCHMETIENLKKKKTGVIFPRVALKLSGCRGGGCLY